MTSELPANDVSGALRTVLNILDAWKVSPQDRLALLGCDQETYDRWLLTREIGTHSADTLIRLSYILGIWKALNTLFPAPENASAWIHRTNSAAEFGGQTPLTVMIQGRIEDLSLVRRFLDGWLT